MARGNFITYNETVTELIALRSLLNWPSALIWTLAFLCFVIGAVGFFWVGFYNKRQDPTMFQHRLSDLANPRVIPRISMTYLLIHGDDPRGGLGKAMMLFLVPAFLFALLGGIQILAGVIGGAVIVPARPK